MACLLDRRATLARQGPLPLQGAVGVIGEVTWRRRSVVVRGWTHSADLGLGFDDRVPLPAGPGSFVLDLVRPARRANLFVRAGDGLACHVLTAPSRLHELSALLRALPEALVEVAREWRALVRFLGTGDPTASARLRHRFGLMSDAIQVPAFPTDFFKGDDRTYPIARCPVVVIPVHDAAEDLARLVAVLPSSLPADARVVVVDDGSTDPRIARLLAELGAVLGDRLAVLRHDRSYGFVAAANAGLSHATATGTGHAVLLNSDTIPPPD